MYPFAHLVDQPVTFDKITTDTKSDVVILPNLVCGHRKGQGDGRRGKRHQIHRAVANIGTRRETEVSTHRNTLYFTMA